MIRNLSSCTKFAVICLLTVWINASPGALAQAPLDPLTDAEQDGAAEAAVHHPEVIGYVGADPYVGAVMFVVPDKEAFEDGNTERHAAVLLSARSAAGGARALVALGSMQVLEVEPVEVHAVPFGPQELAEAWDLASQDPALQEMVGELELYRVRAEGEPFEALDYEVQGMTVIGTEPGEICHATRCLSLLFRNGDLYLEGVEVLVDLTAGLISVQQGTQ